MPFDLSELRQLFWFMEQTKAEQVCSQLCINAVGFLDSGGLRVDIMLRRLYIVTNVQ